MPSVFRQIARYHPGLLLDPAENRLTETFAALLASSPTIARHLAWQWTGVSFDDEVRVATQVPTASAGFVDLELRFRSPGAPWVVWIEVKLGSEPYEGQLVRYLTDASAAYPSARRSLVLLIPEATAPPRMSLGTSGDVVIDRWQAVGRSVHRLMRSHVVRLTAVEEWLARQFITYLREEGLESATGLRAIDVLALSHAKAAEAVVIGIRQIADDFLASRWERGGPDGSAQRFYRHCRPKDVSVEDWQRQWRGGWFEWGIARDAALPDPRGDLVFGAGYTIQKRLAPSGNAVEEWIAAMGTRGFELVLDDHWRLYRFRYPDALLPYETIEGQGRALGEWVEETFGLLLDASIPPGKPNTF